MTRAEELLRELLKMPVEDRAHAAKRLLDSLDEDPEDPDVQALRAAELTRRARAVADGSAELIDADEVRRRVAARLREASNA
ncbi:MAG TPA: addiction module protein [Kofleriaceae bacterium]|nr:addiction module protein [Kofleriaceae bacterium]